MPEKKMGRPVKNFDKKQFVDLIGMGCTQEEIAWWFRDETGKPANIDTITRWCVREFGLTFQEYSKQNKGVMARIKLRQNQLKLSEKSAAMAIWLGKQMLGQREDPLAGTSERNELLESLVELEKRND